MPVQYSHQLELKVRDYECDMQAVVNNSVYQNYLEHARHEFLQSKGINFADTTKAGINLVVVRAELDYRDSLKSNDTFAVKTALQRISRLRFLFIQDIYRLADNKVMLQARITGAALNHLGRPVKLQLLDELFT
ncbi:MAG: acyl-CoA thioesterase [Gammaproteobacteria bacterium]|nr:acyl-CoA thioesterase [Gammaproteobacteria bacterium]